MIIIFQREICQAFNTHFAAAGHLFDYTNMVAPLNETDTPPAVRHGLFKIHPKAFNTIATKKYRKGPHFLKLVTLIILEHITYMYLSYLFYQAEFMLYGKQHM